MNWETNYNEQQQERIQQTESNLQTHTFWKDTNALDKIGRGIKKKNSTDRYKDPPINLHKKYEF